MAGVEDSLPDKTSSLTEKNEPHQGKGQCTTKAALLNNQLFNQCYILISAKHLGRQTSGQDTSGKQASDYLLKVYDIFFIIII